jgi:hypothetical protein
MHCRRFRAAGCIALLAIPIVASACANGGTGADFDGNVVKDAGSDRGSVQDSSPLSTYDSSSNSYDTGVVEDSYVAPYDDGGNFPETSTQDDSSGVADTGPDPDVVVPPTGLSILYAVQDSAPMSAYIGCEMSVLNSSTTSIAVSTLEARYYYTDEDTAGVHMTPQLTINWSHVTTSGADTDVTVTYTIVPMPAPATEADTYIAFDFSGTTTSLAPGDSAVFSWQLQGPDPATDIFDQSSDYSFDASKTALTSWDHIVLMQSGSVAWGTPP